MWFATVRALLEAGKAPEETVATAAASKTDKAPTVPTKGSAAAAAQTVAAARQEAAAALQKRKLERLVQHLHMLLVHDEEAANTVMGAIGDLPYDQLQTIEVHALPDVLGCSAPNNAFFSGMQFMLHQGQA